MLFREKVRSDLEILLGHACSKLCLGSFSAARMAQDHGNANSELASLGRSKHLGVPARVNAKHQVTSDMLQRQSSANFDAAYANLMVADHARAIALFSNEVQSPDADFAAFANKTLPILQAHKKMADDLSVKMGSTAA